MGLTMTADPGARPVKRSLTLSGHRTSVTLEAPFWAVLRAMAAAEGVSMNALATRIDAARAGDAGLASALRVAALEWALAQPMVASPGKVSSSQ
jgi:predicted DNA-binding ribbon-helix-helix protein